MLLQGRIYAECYDAYILNSKLSNIGRGAGQKYEKKEAIEFHGV